MKTIKGNTENIKQLYDSLNLYYNYPNVLTLTNDYSSIVIEYATEIPCILVNDCDVDLVNSIDGLTIEDGNTIKREPVANFDNHKETF